MPNQELLAFIKSQTVKGLDKETIKQKLIENEWAGSIIEEGFKHLEDNKTDDSVPVVSKSIDDKETSSEKLPDILVLLKESFEIYKTKIWKLLALIVMPVVISIAGIMLVSGIGLSMGIANIAGLSLSAFFTLAPLVLALIIIFVLAIYWSNVSMLLIITKNKEALSILDALKQSKRFILPFLWIGLLQMFMFITGFLLFIIPALFLYIYIVFSQFIMIEDGERGFAAITKSYNYVRGYAADIALRVYVVVAVMIFISYLLKDLQTLSSIFSFLVSPFIVIYYYTLYTHLKSLHPIDDNQTEGKKIFQWLAGVGMFLVFVVVPVSGIFIAIAFSRLSF